MIDLGSWRAILAPIGEPTIDGSRVLATATSVRQHPDQRRPLWHDRPGRGRLVIGTVDTLYVVEGLLMSAGTFRVDDDDEWYTMGLIEGMRAGRVVPVMEVAEVEADRAVSHPLTITSSVLMGVTAATTALTAWHIPRFEVS